MQNNLLLNTTKNYLKPEQLQILEKKFMMITNPIKKGACMAKWSVHNEINLEITKNLFNLVSFHHTFYQFSRFKIIPYSNKSLL